LAAALPTNTHTPLATPTKTPPIEKVLLNAGAKGREGGAKGREGGARGPWHQG